MRKSKNLNQLLPGTDGDNGVQHHHRSLRLVHVGDLHQWTDCCWRCLLHDLEVRPLFFTLLYVLFSLLYFTLGFIILVFRALGPAIGGSIGIMFTVSRFYQTEPETLSTEYDQVHVKGSL